MAQIATNSQKCSKAVFDAVQQFIDKNKSNEELLLSYRSLCKSAGGMLRTVGLSQFLVYLQAKGDSEHSYFLELLNQLSAEFYEVFEAHKGPRADGDKLIQDVQKQELPQYMFCTRRILILLQWHKRIASVLISPRDNKGSV